MNVIMTSRFGNLYYRPSGQDRSQINSVANPHWLYVNFIAKPFTFDQLGHKIREVLS
jgi:hypothetical protein